MASSLGTGDEKKQKTEQGEIFTYGKPKEGKYNGLIEIIRMMNRIKKGGESNERRRYKYTCY